MNTNSIVSVIIIFLNAGKFIQEAIESVISQTHENWELLLIDDGSTDDSTAIAREFADRYPDRMLYLEHENHQNRGKSSSRNLGIGKASGEYIAFLDADDIFLPLKLAKQIAIIESSPEAAMVYGNTLYWHSWTNHPDDLHRDYVLPLGIPANTLVEPPLLMRLLIGDSGAVPCICSFLVKRDLVLQVGGFEESIQHLYEDRVFLAKIFLMFPVFVEDGCWEKYRQRSDSSWHLSMSSGEDERAYSIFLNWLERYWVDKSFQKTATWQFLQDKLWHDRHPILSHQIDRLKSIGSHSKQLIKKISNFILNVTRSDRDR
jgi:glycosyltransferase involved in cell wall biosynthesis